MDIFSMTNDELIDYLGGRMFLVNEAREKERDQFFEMKETSFFEGLEYDKRNHSAPYTPNRGYGTMVEQEDRLKTIWGWIHGD